MKIPVLCHLEKAFNVKIKRPLKKYIEDLYLKKHILNKYKYIHVMNNGIHSIGIIKFLQKYFDNSEHAFIFPFLRKETKEKLFGLSNIYNCDITAIPFENIDKIVFHGMFTPLFMDCLYKHKKYLSKSYWFIWGGDLYKSEETESSAYVKKNVAGILTSFDGDVYKDKYGDKKCYDVTYPHDPVELSVEKQQKSKDAPINILINNCADVTTLEMLDNLAKFESENINIYTILSYISANQKDCRLAIMKKGFEIFGKKFIPITDFMDKESYAKFLASMDIYISNQNRQQGNGNASLICSLGGKVYTKSDTSVYKKYNSLGIRYFDTYDIPKMSFDEFIAYDDKEKENTIKLLKERMKDETKVKQWEDFFND